MPIQIRILTWNIAEGRAQDPSQQNSSIASIVERIREFCPDILLLNEVLNYHGAGMKQAQEIARRLSIPHVADSNHTPIGLIASKSVSILARYPLSGVVVHPVRSQGANTSYCILAAATMIQGRRHHLYSLRFDAWNQVHKLAGISQMALMASTARSTEAVILGGDFNAEASTQEMIDFAGNSLTKNAMDRPSVSEWVSADGNRLVDAIFFRGASFAPYDNLYLRAANDWTTDPRHSDHPYVVVDLVDQGSGLEAAFGARLKLKHWFTGTALHSHLLDYQHESGTAQQQVTGFASRDDNDFWVVENAVNPLQTGTPVGYGAEVRLRHEATGKWLQGDESFFSPVTSNMQVAATSNPGPGAVWVLELEKSSGRLLLGDRLRLRHKVTGRYLYAIPGARDGQQTAGQQEVCGAMSQGSYSLWAVFELHNPSAVVNVPAGWLGVIVEWLSKFFKRG